MKPASSPNWLEYDKSGKVVGRRFYPPEAVRVMAATQAFIDNVPPPPTKLVVSRPVAKVLRKMERLDPSLFHEAPASLPAKPPRPRRAQ